ncbi:hypothetical protein BLA29_004704, partial [Euroglyphus maynei]
MSESTLINFKRKQLIAIEINWRANPSLKIQDFYDKWSKKFGNNDAKESNDENVDEHVQPSPPSSSAPEKTMNKRPKRANAIVDYGETEQAEQPMEQQQEDQEEPQPSNEKVVIKRVRKEVKNNAKVGVVGKSTVTGDQQPEENRKQTRGRKKQPLTTTIIPETEIAEAEEEM